MRVFITGASGHIASALIPELLNRRHTVLGLARSDRAAQIVAAAGAQTVRGGLSDFEVLRRSARAADAVIHLALFDTDALRSGNTSAAGRAGSLALNELGEVLSGTGKALVSAAAIGALGPRGRTVTEADRASADGAGAQESAVLGFADREVRSAVVRLPLIIHSLPDRPGLTGAMIAAARRTGTAGYVGDGTNRWPATHTSDVARLFRIAAESAPPATVWHAVAEEGLHVRAIAEAIGTHLGIPTESMSPNGLQERFGFVGNLFGLDLPAASATTRAQADWEPTGPTLLEDMRARRFYIGS